MQIVKSLDFFNTFKTAPDKRVIKSDFKSFLGHENLYIFGFKKGIILH
jgi:hypothetical protein